MPSEDILQSEPIPWGGSIFFNRTASVGFHFFDRDLKIHRCGMTSEHNYRPQRQNNLPHLTTCLSDRLSPSMQCIIKRVIFHHFINRGICNPIIFKYVVFNRSEEHTSELQSR